MLQRRHRGSEEQRQHQNKGSDTEAQPEQLQQLRISKAKRSWLSRPLHRSSSKQSMASSMSDSHPPQTPEKPAGYVSGGAIGGSGGRGRSGTGGTAGSSTGPAAASSPAAGQHLRADGTTSTGAHGSAHAAQNDSPSHPSHIKRSHSPVPQWPELPEAPPPAVFGKGYSGRKKVPTVSQYADIQKKHEKEAQEYDRLLQEREAAMRANGELSSESDDLAEPTSPTTSTKPGGTAPTSPMSPTKSGRAESRPDKLDGAIKDGQHSAEEAAPNAGSNEKQRLMEQMNANKEKPTELAKRGQHGQRRVRDPITGMPVVIKDADPKDFDTSRPRIKGSNVLYHEFPAPMPEGVQDVFNQFEQMEKMVIAGIGILWVLVAFGGGFFWFMIRSGLCVAAGVGLMSAISINKHKMEKEIEAMRQAQHRERGMTMVPPMPESVEWLNGLIHLVWGLIDNQLFVPMADTVEDILQQSLPSFVDAVRITDVDQGSNAVRFTSIRALPDQPGDNGYPKKDWIDEGKDIPLTDSTGKELQEDQAGDYYNFEAAFAYSALPGQKDRSKNIHLLIQFFVGMYDWFHIPIPLWIQIEQIYGIVRLRVQFIPEPPFVRNVTFALCGVPAVEVSAIPMSRHLPNVLDLPFVSMFVKQGIAAGTTELCVPKSMTLNIQEMLSGTVGDTHAIGVFAVTIHYCEGLSAQDNNGYSDPYIVLAYAKYGRPLYSTRIILQDLNPVYEETAFLLMSMDEVRSKEELVAMLWDSDKMSADDLVGRVQIPVDELMLQPNKMFRREDSLKGFEDGNDMPGKLVWSIGYFDRAPLRKEYERLPSKEEAKEDPGSPGAPSKEMLPNDAAPNPARDFLPPDPPDLAKTHPDPRWPSGILSIILHQVTNLERQNLEGKSGKEREGEAGQDTDDPSEQTQNLPSGYGEFIVNDQLIYKTRVKQYTVNPYFEAGTEVFVRDFRTTEVRVVIRDSRLRESDPILGIVSVNLADVFAECSSIKKVYPIQEGQGFGKANISFAFRGVQATLPANLRGWDTGTLVISQVRLKGDPSKRDVWQPHESTLVVETNESTETMKKRHAEEDNGEILWDVEPLNMPIYNRYQAHVWFKFGQAGLGSLVGRGKPEALAILWLQDLTDLMDAEVELPVIIGDDMKQLRQNVLNDQTLKDHKFEVVGSITARMEFTPGLDLYHENLRLSQGRRHAFEAWMAVEGEAEIAERQQHFQDDGVIDKHEGREMKKLHRRQLESRGRGMAQVGAYRSAKWMGRGLRDRLPGRKKTREPTIQTEA